MLDCNGGRGKFWFGILHETVGKNYYIHDLDKDIVIKHGVATKRSSLQGL